MKLLHIKDTNLNVSNIALGLMRITNLSLPKAEELLDTALDLGINFFDHADIYGSGESEKLFSKAIKLTDDKREKIIIQSKCGIRKGFFDFSKEHILKSVDDILLRLNTDYLDVLLLHRPDILVEPEEVSEAFNILIENKKVRQFGVSNQKPMQIELLQKFLSQKIIFNQLQFSITNATMLSNGVNVNMQNDAALDRDGSVIDYCRLHDITIQPWSPFQYGFFEGVFLDNEKFSDLNAKINEIAKEYNVTNTTIATAWILRHPANMQPIVGTMDKNRLKEICKANDFTLTREQWYDIYRANGNILP